MPFRKRCSMDSLVSRAQQQSLTKAVIEREPIVFENFVNHLLILFVEYELLVKPFYQTFA